MNFKIRLKITTLIVALLVSCQVMAEDDATPAPLNSNNQDPYETFNRPMFYFNDWLDRVILKPVATLYNTILPMPLRKGISNFYNNIDMIPTVINDLLQGNFYQATSDTWRFGINSTIGILGFFDVATEIGLEPNREDLGLTLAQWGWKNSNYLVLPFVGPGTVRDQLSWPLNYQYMSIYPYIHSDNLRYGLYFGGLLVRRAELLHYEGLMETAALDKYTFVRDAYFQRRAYQIQRNKELGNPYLETNEAIESS